MLSYEETYDHTLRGVRELINELEGDEVHHAAVADALTFVLASIFTLEEMLPERPCLGDRLADAAYEAMYDVVQEVAEAN